MSTARTKTIPTGSDGASPSQAPGHGPAPGPLEVDAPLGHVPSFDEIQRLTAIPDRRVVFRGVAWSFYDQLVESIPKSSHIHVDYDGTDLEVVANGWEHEDRADALGDFVKVVAVEMRIAYKSLRETTWNRQEIARGLESDQCYCFAPEKLAQIARARGRRDVSLLPNPDLAIEVDLSRPETDRAGIYLALDVQEIWRFTDNRIIIERLTPSGTYVAVKVSGLLPVSDEEIKRWIVDEDRTDDADWFRRMQTYFKAKAAERTKRKRKTKKTT